MLCSSLAWSSSGEGELLIRSRGEQLRVLAAVLLPGVVVGLFVLSSIRGLSTMRTDTTPTDVQTTSQVGRYTRPGACGGVRDRHSCTDSIVGVAFVRQGYVIAHRNRHTFHSRQLHHEDPSIALHNRAIGAIGFRHSSCICDNRYQCGSFPACDVPALGACDAKGYSDHHAAAVLARFRARGHEPRRGGFLAVPRGRA